MYKIYLLKHNLCVIKFTNCTFPLRMEVFESDADDIQTKGSRWLIKRPISIIPVVAKVFERIIYD